MGGGAPPPPAPWPAPAAAARASTADSRPSRPAASSACTAGGNPPGHTSPAAPPAEGAKRTTRRIPSSASVDVVELLPCPFIGLALGWVTIPPSCPPPRSRPGGNRPRSPWDHGGRGQHRSTAPGPPPRRSPGIPLSRGAPRPIRRPAEEGSDMPSGPSRAAQEARSRPPGRPAAHLRHVHQPDQHRRPPRRGRRARPCPVPERLLPGSSAAGLGSSAAVDRRAGVSLPTPAGTPTHAIRQKSMHSRSVPSRKWDLHEGRGS